MRFNRKILLGIGVGSLGEWRYFCRGVTRLSTDTNRLLDDTFQLLRHPRMWRNQTVFLSLFERAVGGLGVYSSTSEGCDLALSEKERRKDDDIDRYSLSSR
jgi:hypothetical protein